MKIKQVVEKIEQWCPPSIQESYDNCGLLAGDPENEVTGCLISLDVTEEIIDEAIKKGHNLIISHHPIIFKGLKKLTGSTLVERCIMKAIKNDVALYAIHTNLDNLYDGVNSKIAEKLSLQVKGILSPKSGSLLKLAVFVPLENKTKLLNGLYAAGAGEIGNYSSCSFSTIGEGTFEPNDQAQPYIGERHNLTRVNEAKVEVIVPKHKLSSVLKALPNVHPYEEIAYDLYQMENQHERLGAGMICELNEEMTEQEFLSHVQKTMGTKAIRHSDFLGKKVKRVAICGGSGTFLLGQAMRASADVYLTGDITYHTFFETNNKLLLCDIGHYESEQFTGEIIADFLAQNFNTFAASLAEGQKNPVNYFI